MSIILLNSILAPVFGNHIGGHPRLVPTSLVLDQLPECTNSVQCNATLLAGDIVTFTGALTDNQGEFISDAQVNIYRFTATSMQLLASTITERDGTFKTTWTTQFLDKNRAGETFYQQISEVLILFAKFESDNRYTTAQSDKMMITIKIKDMITVAATDKLLYRSGDIATIFVNFIEMDDSSEKMRYGSFVEPYNMRVTYDNEAVHLSKKKLGSYTFITPPLTVGHHQLMINPTREGYNSSLGFITVQVSGFFGK